MWRKKVQRSVHADELAVSASDSLIDESAAFLLGHYAQYLMGRKLPIPAWAWLNGLSHGDIDDIRALAKRDATSGPSAVIADLAAQMMTLLETQRLSLASIQSRILIPLELRLAATPWIGCPHDAEELAEMLRGALSNGSRPLWQSVQRQGRVSDHAKRKPSTERFWEV